MELRRIGEFGLIQRIQEKWPALPPSVLLGIGDDAAAILPSSRKVLLLTTDSLIEHVHFDLSFCAFGQLGYKAVMVNVSDIAAMGGDSRFFLISLNLTPRQTVQEVDALYRGMEKAGREVGLALLGGNTTYSEETFFVALTLVGDVPKKEMTRRSGGRAGEALYVTGTLGDAAAGLELLQKGGETKRFRDLTRRYQIPSARWREGRLLGKEGIASSMIDISDGLTSDLGHLMERSGVGAVLDLTQIPLSPALKRYALQTGVDPLKYALRGGEDYELLFSVSPTKIKKLESFMRRGLIRASRIGALVQNKNELIGRDRTGRIHRLEPRGYDHFKAGGGVRRR